jgi:AAA family ATP:ADP antiporter
VIAFSFLTCEHHKQARRLAASVDQPNGPSSESWHKMGTSSSSVARSSAKKSSDAKESLVKPKPRKSKQNEPESIYDQDALDEVQGRTSEIDSDEEGDDDDFIEAPLQHDYMLRSQDVADLPAPLGSLVLCLQRSYYVMRNCVKRVHRRIYGDSFPWEDFTRTLVLSSTLFIMIGGYWLLRSLKDPVLTALCGVKAIPKAKMLSVFVVLGVVAVYNHLLDEESGFRKEQVREYVI